MFALTPNNKQSEEHVKLTFIPAPENKNQNLSVQLGLFDAAPAENINRAIAYINPWMKQLFKSKLQG